MKAFRVLSEIDAGRVFAPGELIDLEPGEAAPLIAAGIIEDPAAPDAGGAPSPAVAAILAAMHALGDEDFAGLAEALSADDTLRERALKMTPAESPAAENEGGEIAQAIASLDPDDEALWTKSGKPKTAAVEAALKRDVTAGEVADAWEALKASRAAEGA